MGDFTNNSKDLRLNEWIGIVEDNNDPNFSGRCKVRVFGVYDGKENDKIDNSPYTIPTDKLPWAYPATGIIFGSGEGAGNLSVPKNGAKVKIRFNGGNLYAPEYFAVQDINDDLVNEISDSYLDSHVLMFDKEQDLKVLYKKNIGMQIYFKGSNIMINPDSSISIEHKDTKSIIELVNGTINIVANSTINLTSNTKIQAETSEAIINGNTSTKLGPSPQYSSVLAEPLWMFLKMMAQAIDAKAPSTPGVMTAQADAFETISTSKNVKLSP